MIDAKKYLSARWVEGGRVWPEVDCYGIIMEIRKDLGLEEWPAWDGVSKRDNGLHSVGSQFVATRSPCVPQEGAVVCCYTASLMTHVAIVVEVKGALYVAECNPKSGFTCIPLRRFQRHWLRLEFYR